MNRKEFTKKLLAGAAGAAALGAFSFKKVKASTYDKMMEQVGFNHLPNVKNESTMKTVIHRANTRGHANHGWLDTSHTFSFANYYNPERMHFGVLRVLNDDYVNGGRGFGTHPHDNMEIISIPLEGDLEHKDSMGNTFVIRKNDVQIMSAGTGIFHSEYNKNPDKKVNFLQIWVFPKVKNIAPKYGQVTYNPSDRKNKWQRVVSPENDGTVTINQDAYFYLTDLDANKKLNYATHLPGNGVYFFVIKGSVSINGEQLNQRDGMGVWDTSSVSIEASQQTELLAMEIPMIP